METKATKNLKLFYERKHYYQENIKSIVTDFNGISVWAYSMPKSLGITYMCILRDLRVLRILI